MLALNARGNYRFVTAPGMPFSSGAVADLGFAIVHASFHPMVRLADGYGSIERHLRDVQRPIHAVCGIELRIPAPLTPAGFDEFNRGYLERLAAWGVLIDGVNPIARTNVAPMTNAPAEPSLFGFYYTVPNPGVARPAYVLAGSAEMRAGEGGRRELVARGDVSPDGLGRKMACVLDNLSELIGEMKVRWDDATSVNLYTVHDVHPLFEKLLLPALGAAAIRGIRFHHSRPPVTGLEMEIDACAAREELLISAT